MTAVSHHDHHHHDPLTEAVNRAVGNAITNPTLIQTIMSTTMEQQAIATLQAAERMRPVLLREAIVAPQAYNDRGDTLLLLNRRMRHAENAMNIIITFNTQTDGNVTYSTVMYRDHQFDTLGTKFIEVQDPAAQEELNRQIASLWKPERADKSVQLTVMMCPELLKNEQQPQPAPEPAHHPVAAQQPLVDRGHDPREYEQRFREAPVEQDLSSSPMPLPRF